MKKILFALAVVSLVGCQVKHTVDVTSKPYRDATEVTNNTHKYIMQVGIVDVPTYKLMKADLSDGGQCTVYIQQRHGESKPVRFWADDNNEPSKCQRVVGSILNNFAKINFPVKPADVPEVIALHYLIGK
ncbi:hypothetical protein WKH27_12195 [Pantoea agglomerans]|uniref:hypothetical protein n=1 Tax=Enterobacter agglomerans TaxID=549 RepID=UPI002897E6D0|nr:hypothetical protein [Pantoea agglomerans]WNK37623.1 hypothetical protein RM158_20495 [Pantoea agglomerans]WNK55799.1 hypothetical protein RM154_20025 [Pantoea agglomerans]